ncbi:MAG: hypothetical protein N4A53_07440 [Pelagimonas sp.]|jgi:hypothetical protein|nr:hypothetical protein [Pelagimonas sp.]
MYKDMTAEAVLQVLAGMPKRTRIKTSQMLIYKKGRRPADLKEQQYLLNKLSDDPTLAEIDRVYALIAGGHKTCELLDLEGAEAWSARLAEVLPQVRAFPYVFGLRRDRTHVVFSLLNVAMNVDLIAGGHRYAEFAQTVLDEVDGLKLRKMTPYLFNSSSNIVKAVGMALLCKPDERARQADLMARLMSYAVEINNPIFWYVFSRFTAPASLRQVEIRAAFGSFRNSMQRLTHIEEAAAADPADLPLKMRQIAGSCLAQSRPEQHIMLQERVQTLFGDSWQ